MRVCVCVRERNQIYEQAVACTCGLHKVQPKWVAGPFPIFSIFGHGYFLFLKRRAYL